ncbi:hypothetical protein ABH37_10685 [Mycobacterium haemophilum]|uniref:Uncharacterized protein n=1 Tax=Mycobacterium haemophilum TaxID=29311 RepID=A0A0I9Y945_9MYCO|nr:hypothetical protein ABH39_08135 [Mycobacterium haemophilum]KLO36302.1 hypothetical protein ABH38_12055 [Mycobacterium haemophilum]KLO42186.1 hypothetical protein ABH37_10685 [Mycobacterium haemophilum]KLO49989.1 hypothetical protein ABH36_08605 [Mycobacterium haemophilum]
MLQVVLKQKIDVAMLDLLAGGHVGQINQGTIELQDRGPVALDMTAHRVEVRPEVSEHLAQTRFRQVSAIQRAEATVEVVETMTELI